MRLIAWNSNFNNKGRSFEEDATCLFAEGADLIVLSESTRPKTPQNSQCGWTHWKAGKDLGLGVVAGPGYQLTASPLNASAPAIFSGYKVQGPVSFNLLASWPVNEEGTPSYTRLLNSALDHFEGFLTEGPTIMAGDYNSSTKVKEQAATHPAFVARMAGLNLHSAYHHRTREQHGLETKHTFRCSHGQFHIDYCFLSPGLLNAAQVEILDVPIWESRSDHYAVQVDLPDLSYPRVAYMPETFGRRLFARFSRPIRD